MVAYPQVKITESNIAHIGTGQIYLLQLEIARFACVLWCSISVIIELPIDLNAEYIILISEEMWNYRQWQSIQRFPFIILFTIQSGNTFSLLLFLSEFDIMN
jgi:hypothetical protein